MTKEKKPNKKVRALILSLLILIVLIVIIVLCVFAHTKKEGKIEELETYRINFETDGGTAVAAIEVEEGEFLEVPEEPTKEGYIFVGWMLDDEFYDFASEVSGDITLKATWKEKEPDKIYYTVTFDTVGGTPISSQVLEDGKVVVRPATNPVKEGYDFKGWKVADEDYTFEEPIHSDITIVAVWEKVEVKESEEPTPSKPTTSTQNPSTSTPTTQTPSTPKKYTVKFNANGGTLGSGCSDQIVENGQGAKNTCKATRSGYTLVGFNTNSSATTSNISSRAITSNTTYYAIWSKNQSIPSTSNITITFSAPTNVGKVTFGSCGTGSSISKTIASGNTIESAYSSCKTNPTSKYYTFAGWSSSGVVDSSKTVMSSWNEKTFKIKAISYSDDSITPSGNIISLTEYQNDVQEIVIKNKRGSWTYNSENGFKDKNLNYYNNMTECYVKFKDSDKTFVCTK